MVPGTRVAVSGRKTGFCGAGGGPAAIHPLPDTGGPSDTPLPEHRLSVQVNRPPSRPKFVTRQESARGGIERALADAEELFKGGHPRDAVRLLEHLDVSGPDQMRVSRRLARYKKALLPPTPTPVPDEATQAQTAFDEGRLIEAYTKVQAGLEKHSMDPGLQELRERILAEEPSIGPLTEALSKKEYQTVLGICRTLVVKDPDNAEYREFLERSLFNQAISELRKYNLTEADLRLAELEEINPGDEEVQRIRRFIAKYKTRPADMQLKIFIASLGQR